jgi:hypothetical protein
MTNFQLKNITQIEPISGGKVTLNFGMTKHFMAGGSWEYKKDGSGFSLSPTVATDFNNPDPSFITATYHDNGKLLSRGMANLGYGFNFQGDIQYQNADNAGYSLELTKNFLRSYATVKCGTEFRSFTFMQTLYKNCFAGFECAYIVMEYHLRLK